MKTQQHIKPAALLLFLIMGKIIFSQSLPEKGVKFGVIKESFDNSVSKNLFSGKNAIQSNFSADISKDFALTLDLKLEPDSMLADGKEIKRPWSFALSGNLGSTNKYTPLLDKGKWAVSTKLGLTYIYAFGSRRWFFTSDIEKQRELKNANKDDTAKLKDTPEDNQSLMKDMDDALKSQYQTFWFSSKLEYNFNNFLLVKDSIHPAMKELTINNRISGMSLTLQLNGLRVFSMRKGIQLSGAFFGYTYSYNSDNYETLKEVKVSEYYTVSDSLGNSVRVSSEETKARKGKLDFSNGHTLFADIHFTINSKPNHKLAVDIYAKPEFTINKDSKILNLRTGLNFAVLGSDEKSVANVGFAVDFKDLTESFDGADDYKNRIIPALTLGVPFPEIGKH